MGLEISRITDCASWHTVVGMEYSTVFDKCSSPVNWVEPFVKGTQKTKKRLRGAWVLVCPEGIEPPTHSLEGCCSIQLSYGQVRN